MNNQTWNIIILLIQAIILIGQLLLSQKMNKQSISREKGYFLIEKTNIPNPKSERDKFTDQFDLKSDRGIGFYAVKNDVILRSYSYSVNSVIYENNQPSDIFFTENSRFNALKIILNLKEHDFKKDYLDIELVFELRNTVGYEYKETVNIRFSKNDPSPYYIITKYNMAFNL